jgi:hypothetical protein
VAKRAACLGRNTWVPPLGRRVLADENAEA